MTDDELVGKVAQHIEAAFDERIAVYWKIIGPAALSIASPIIEREALEKAAKVVDIAYHQEPFGDDATITIADDPTKIAAAIRALTEQSK